MATLSILEIENWSKGTEVLLTSPNILHYRVFRKWHTVAVVICAVRIFNSHISKANANVLHRGNDDNQEKKVRFSMGDVVNTVQQPQSSSLRKLEGVIIAGEEKEEVLPAVEEFRVEAESLARLVEEKKLLLLEELGGVVGIASVLRTDIDAGISGDPEDVSHRRNYFGENSYPRKAPQGFLKFLVEAFRDTTIIILMICSMLSLGFGIKSEGAKDGWYDGASIAFAVVLVVTVTAISDYRQSRQFQKLNVERSNIQVDVFRGGRRFKVSIYDLVVGDVVPLNIGDLVPADGLLVGGYSLEIDESSMTGESDLVHKDRTNDPFLVSGTKVANGFGSMLVTSVGTNTQWGQMMSTLAHHSAPQTPLQIRLSGVATFVGKIGLTVALVVLLVLLVRYFSGKTHDKNGSRAFTAGQTSVSDAIDGVVDIIAIAVTIVVVAIPEGLPLAVTLTLAYSMKKMMTDNALVRKLSACETMGSATTICTDKTGTLTLNQMTVTRAWVAGDMRVLPDQVNGNIPIDSTRSSLFQAVALNTTGSVYLPESDNAEGAVEVSGSPTEKAILSWALKMGMMNPNRLKLDHSILHVEAFNSEKKRSRVAIKDLKTQEIRVHWKGAAEIILGLCSHCIHSDGKMVHLDEGRRENLQRIIEGLAAASLRCIAFAYKSVSHSVEDDEDEKDVSGGCEMSEGGLALLAIVGLKDPCRPGVGKAVECCKAAGVNVRMVTGDNVLTAKAIALECGILGRDQTLGEPTVIEGEVFRKYSPEQRMSCVDKICVMARSSPSDKLLMVQSLREKGHVVAVTGDGTNDAPALQEADIGLAMGVQGTEVAKDSSDIIILDDNFSSVVTVVRWGRSVYSNIQKFIQFQLTVNVAALVINFVAAVSSGDVPLTAVQLLWVNLIMDTLGALALATEPPTDELMSAPPVGRSDPLITNFMWRNLVAQSIYQITVLLTLTFKGTTILRLEGNDRSDDINKTMIFNTFVLCQVFNEFNARKPQEKNVFKGIAKNRLFMGIVGVTLLLQVLMVEFLKKFASTERLDWGQWIICIAIASFSWPIAWLIKYVPVPQRPFHQYMKEYLEARKKT